MGTADRSTAGFTIVELLVVVIVGALVLGAAYQVLAVQERSYRQQGAAITTQQTMRGALDVLEAELREVSASGGDLIAIAPTQISFRAYRAVGFICNLDGPGQRVVVLQPPGTPQFTTTDPIVYFMEGTRSTGADDTWGMITASQVDTGTCDAAWGGVQGARLNVPGFDFTNVELGAPIRSFEPYMYGLVQIDGEWVLARQGASDASPVALIGPLQPSPDGLQFQYLDADGNTTTNPTQVARIAITVRGRTRGTGVPGQEFYTDQLQTQLFLRN